MKYLMLLLLVIITCPIAFGKGNNYETTSTRIIMSPNAKLEAMVLRTADIAVKHGRREYDAYSILYIKIKGDMDGIFLGNYGSFDVHWSRDSKFLIVSKKYMTHNSDLDIYRVKSDGATFINLDLIYRKSAIDLPEGESWISWDFVKWGDNMRTVRIEEWNENNNELKTQEYDVSLESTSIQIFQYKKIIK